MKLFPLFITAYSVVTNRQELFNKRDELKQLETMLDELQVHPHPHCVSLLLLIVIN